MAAWAGLREAGTPGEWVVCDEFGNIVSVDDPNFVPSRKQATKNNRLAVASVALVPDLIAEVERLRRERDGWVLQFYVAIDERNQAIAIRDEAQARAARLALALEEIAGLPNVPDGDGLIEDWTCCYCDCDSISVDWCDDDCPRKLAWNALGDGSFLRWLEAREKRAAAVEMEKMSLAWVDAMPASFHSDSVIGLKDRAAVLRAEADALEGKA